MNKYVKVMFGITSGAKSNFKYKVNEVNVSENWNPNAENGREFGGFNYCSEECILRWLHRGDVIYDVEIPKDAENIRLDGATTIYRTNKIIISNPRKVNDELALHFYEISKIPEKSYYKSLAVVSIMNYRRTAYAIFKDKVNKNNINQVLEEWNDFISHGDKNDRKDTNELVKEIENYLYEVKSNLLISRFVDKEPYIKDITHDKVINITGESGSGKSYYTNQYKDNEDYIIIDTDEVFSRYEKSTGYDRKLGMYFRNKYSQLPSLFEDFDLIYSEILRYFDGYNQTIIIDSAQYRNMNDISLLKGKLIVMRTSIDKCYQRCIDRWKHQNHNYINEELEKYSDRKRGIYSWYKDLNNFLEKVENIKK